MLRNNRYFRFFYGILKRIIRFFTMFFPRNNNLWVIGSYKWLFVDNSKYFFYEAVNNFDIKVYWISENEKTIENIKSQGYENIIYKWSFKGIYLCLRAGTYFVSNTIDDISYSLSGNAKYVNLWHGLPIKKIEFDIKEGAIKNIYNKTFFSKTFYPQKYVRPDLFVSCSSYFTDLFCSAFRIQRDQCLEVGSPRTDHFFLTKEELELFLQDKLTNSERDFLSRINMYKKVYVYMPTFRDYSSISIIESGMFNLDKLNACMKDKDSVFIFKLHPNEKIGDYIHKKYSNIIFCIDGYDMYTVLPYTDVLITDYSSIFFDYLLLEKEIILYPFDIDSYLKYSREMYIDYYDTIEGNKVAYTFEQLIESFKSEKMDNSSLKDKYWGNYEGKSSLRIINYLLQKN